jgi:hypothetical protein
MRQQQVWQAESGQPRRKLSVGEAAAFAAVFQISLADLMTLPGDDFAVHHLAELGREFADWRRDAGVLFGRLTDIARRVSELGPDETRMAEVIIQGSGLPAAAELAARELGELEQMVTDTQQAIAAGGGAWPLVLSLRDQVSAGGPEEADPAPAADRATSALRERIRAARSDSPADRERARD